MKLKNGIGLTQIFEAHIVLLSSKKRLLNFSLPN